MAAGPGLRIEARYVCFLLIYLQKTKVTPSHAVKYSNCVQTLILPDQITYRRGGWIANLKMNSLIAHGDDIISETI